MFGALCGEFQKAQGHDSLFLKIVVCWNLFILQVLWSKVQSVLSPNLCYIEFDLLCLLHVARSSQVLAPLSISLFSAFPLVFTLPVIGRSN